MDSLFNNASQEFKDINAKDLKNEMKGTKTERKKYRENVLVDISYDEKLRNL